MNLEDRLLWLAIGCVLGFFVGYIVRSLHEQSQTLDEIKAELDEVDDIVKEERILRRKRRKTKHEDGIMSHRVTANIALGFVVLIAFWAAIASQKNSNQLEENVKNDKINACRAGVDNRIVQRQTVDAVFTLASSLAELTPKQAADLSPNQIAQYNAYVDKVNKFRDDMYAKIQPSERCEPYVDDENVKPSTPAYPHLETPVGR